MATNFTDFIPIAVALLSGVGVRLLEHVIGKRVQRTRETAELKKAELERDKFIVDKALLLVEKIEYSLEEAKKEIIQLRVELVKANSRIRELKSELAEYKEN